MNEEQITQLIGSNLTLAFLLERNRLVLSDPTYYKDHDPDPATIWEEIFSIFTKSQKAFVLYQQGQDPALCEDESQYK